MDSEQLFHYPGLLLAKRAEILARTSARGLSRPPEVSWRGDFVDQAGEEAEISMQMRLRETESRLLRAIDKALGRIQAGAYGERCGEPIPPARLEAVPWTRICRACKEESG